MELSKSPYKYPSRHAAFAYDAVWTIALTLNRSISALKQQNETRNMTLADFDYNNTAMMKTFMKNAKAVSFQGMSVSRSYIFVKCFTLQMADINAKCKESTFILQNLTNISQQTNYICQQIVSRLNSVKSFKILL